MLYAPAPYLGAGFFYAKMSCTFSYNML